MTGITGIGATARADDEPGRDVPPIPAREIHAPATPSEFLVETRGFLRVVYHPSAFDAVRRIVGGADAIRASLATTLGQSVLDHVEVRVARTADEMAQLSPADAPPSAHSTSAAYPSLSLIVLSIRNAEGVPSPLDEAFHHQLAHVALADAAAGRPLPRWLHEGFAVCSSAESTIARAQILWTADVRDKLLPFASLETFPSDPGAARIAWAESADFVRFLESDSTRFAAAIARARTGDPLDRAFVDAYGRDLRGLEQSWRHDLSTRCVTLPLGVGAGAGWVVAIGALIARRRRKFRRVSGLTPAASPGVKERAWPEPAQSDDAQPADKPIDTSEPRLLVCDRGLGHVVYVVEGKPLPGVEHDGKRHTLH